MVFSSLFIKGWFMKYSESLKKNKDFQLVYKKGTSFVALADAEACAAIALEIL